MMPMPGSSQGGKLLPHHTAQQRQAVMGKHRSLPPTSVLGQGRREGFTVP